MENDERLNDLVPLETRFRYILAENGKLKAEIEHLEEELDKKNKAISEFKKWQKKVAERNYEYWITNAIQLIGDGLERKEYRELLRFFRSYEAYNGSINKLLKEKEKMETNAEKIITRHGMDEIR